MILPLRRYFDFTGRARPREYWMFVVFCILVAVVAGVVDGLLGYGSASVVSGDGSFGAAAQSSGPVGAIVALALVIPGLAVSVRRLHDTDRSGWWLLLSIVPLFGWIALLVFYCTIGTQGPNRFGANPAANSAAAPIA